MEPDTAHETITYEALELAHKANKAFDRRNEAARNLVTVTKIITDAAYGRYSFERATSLDFDGYFVEREQALVNEVNTASAEFESLQLAAAALMPERQ